MHLVNILLGLSTGKLQAGEIVYWMGVTFKVLATGSILVIYRSGRKRLYKFKRLRLQSRDQAAIGE